MALRALVFGNGSKRVCKAQSKYKSLKKSSLTRKIYVLQFKILFSKYDSFSTFCKIGIFYHIWNGEMQIHNNLFLIFIVNSIRFKMVYTSE